MKKFLVGLITFLTLILTVQAEDRTGFLENSKIYINEKVTTKLNDNKYSTYVTLESTDTIKVNNEEKFDSIYIIYYLNSQTGTITYNERTTNIGENSFLHEYIKLDEVTNEVNINYNDTVKIKEIFLFNGDIPKWVQVWENSFNDADILLISTHSDDEQLFFAGLIPTMVASGKKMQVAYFTNHNDNPARLDEQLNGLWAVGVKNYPVFSPIPDAYSETIKAAMANMNAKGIMESDALKYVVDLIRRFKPEVVVGHDENGEYGHGQHKLNTYILESAIDYMNDETFESDYEPFMPYKIYLHLYPENTIKMDYDIPLDYFDGMTAYEVSKLGYKEHNSQQYTWFTKWLTGVNSKGVGTPYTKATEIKTYSPLDYGLYYSSVGYENVDNDMFYGIPEPQVIEATPTVNNENTPVLENNSTPTNFLEDNWYFIICPIIVILLILIVILTRKKKKHWH